MNKQHIDSLDDFMYCEQKKYEENFSFIMMNFMNGKL